jgi:hypothetical protein
MSLEDDDASGSLTSSYDNSYAWATLRSQLTPSTTVETLVSFSHLTWNRLGTDFDRFDGILHETAHVDDARSLDAIAIRQDWAVDFSSSASLLLGAEWRGETADYRYLRTQRELRNVGMSIVTVDSARVEAALAPDGARASAYLAVRWRMGESVTAETGVRADRHDWTDESTVTPRLNLEWRLTGDLTLRLAWGRYAQAQSLHDLSVVDADTAFSRAEVAEHRVAGIEYSLTPRWSLRGEYFERLVRHPRGRWYNTDGDLNALPERLYDRIRLSPSRAAVRGVELLSSADLGDRFRASASIGLTRANAIVNGVETSMPFEERTAAAFDLSRHSPAGWSWTVAWTWHGGWPHIPATFRVDTVSPGVATIVREKSPPLFTDRLGGYQRFDFRLLRTIRAGRGEVTAFIDLFNVFNRSNPRGYEYNARFTQGQLRVERFQLDFLGRLPTVGLSWAF